ncbi:MAG: hypothetical protein ACR2GL_02755 [Thermoleophilaceae bacterium]
MTFLPVFRKLVLACALVATLQVGVAPDARGAFPGANGRIAYASGDVHAGLYYRIFTIGQQGRALRRLPCSFGPLLPPGGCRDIDPAYSPSGRLLAFSTALATPVGTARLVISRSDGSNPRFLSVPDNNQTAPRGPPAAGACSTRPATFPATPTSSGQTAPTPAS